MSKTRFDYAIDHVYDRYSSHINLNTNINGIKSTRQKLLRLFYWGLGV